MRRTAMSKLLVHSHASDADGCRVRVTPESAGWGYVGFEVHRLGAIIRSEQNRETCVVLLSGHADLRAGGETWSGVGRESVFAGEPIALYVPPIIEWSAQGDAEIAVCTAPATTGAELRLLDKPRHESRGSGTEAREISHILMEDEPADSLLVTEVITPAGHWSSFPPHKHDVDDPPRETLLEETYYHRVRPASGFGFQRVYTEDATLD